MDEITAKQRLMILGACFLLVLLFLVILFGEKGYYDYMFLKKQYAEIEKQNSKIEEEGRKTYEVIKRLKTDLDYIEEIARQELGMVLENEIVYQYQTQDTDKEKHEKDSSKESDQKK